MKRIVFFITKLAHGGAERVAVNVANKSAENELNDVHVILSYNNEDTYELDGRIKVHALPFSKNHGIRIIKRMIAIHKLLLRVKPDVIISIPEGTMWYLALDSIWNKPYRLIFSQRNDPDMEYPNKIKKIAANAAFRRADRVVFQTEDQMHFFDKDIQNKGTIILNPLLEDLPQRDLKNIRKEIFTFCRLEKQKNLELLIDAFYEVHKKFPEFVLSIWGKGSLEQTLKEQVARLNIDTCVFFRGFTNDIHHAIKNSYMFVSSSNHEGLSNAMLESMAMGFPVVCTDCPCGGARMVIQDHKNGMLVPVNDKDKMVSAMIEVISNDLLRNKISENAKDIRIIADGSRIYEQWKEVMK